MGLDQFAFIRESEDSKTEISYWRKHPNLQGWMENLWNRKGNTGTFNCVDLELTLGDIDQLEEDIRNGTVAGLETAGFFFGGPSDDYYTEQDLQFVEKAREALTEGKPVFYSSWW